MKLIDRIQAKERVQVIAPGMTLGFGGFGLCGIPQTLISILSDLKLKDLTCVSNNAGVDDWGLGILLKQGKIKKMISSYVGENQTFADMYLKGELEVEFTPQGTLAERLRAGGAGIGGFFTPTGYGTSVAEGKETRVINGKHQILEMGIVCDFGFVRAWKGDALGNLVYRKTAQNFNPLVAMSGRVTFAEVEEIVPVGELDPDDVHTSGAFVQFVLKADPTEKRIENKTVRSGPA